MKQTPDKNQWFPQFKAGNNEAFKSCFDEYNKTVFYIAFRIVGEQTAAEDIVTETFYTLFEHRAEIRSEEHLVGFLKTVARNKGLNQKKHNDLKLAAEAELRHLNEESDKSELSRQLIEAETIKNVYKAVEQLPPKCKAVFKELYFKQATTKEAAERLGISERNVLNQKARAISLLKGIFSG